MAAHDKGFEDPVKASYEFDDQLRKSPEYAVVKSTLSRRRIFGLILAVSIALNVTFSVWSFTTSSNAQTASAKAERAINDGYTTCLSNNKTRADDLKGWHDILALLRLSFTEPEGKTLLDGIYSIVKKKDTPRDCIKLK